MGNFLSDGQIRELRDWYLSSDCSQKVYTKRSGIAGTTIARYRELFEAFEKRHPGRLRKCKDFRIFNPGRLQKIFTRQSQRLVVKY